MANPGGEFVKTKGYYHPENPAGTGYPEVYEVIEGIAHVLLQKKRSIISYSSKPQKATSFSFPRVTGM